MCALPSPTTPLSAQFLRTALFSPRDCFPGFYVTILGSPLLLSHSARCESSRGCIVLSTPGPMAACCGWLLRGAAALIIVNWWGCAPCARVGEVCRSSLTDDGDTLLRASLTSHGLQILDNSLLSFSRKFSPHERLFFAVRDALPSTHSSNTFQTIMCDSLPPSHPPPATM